jgi:DNA-binding FrmR family transcriptional regulator
MIDPDTRGKAVGRLRRIEGQVQGIQRMVQADKPCTEVLLQLAAVEGAVEQVRKLLLDRHVEACVSEAMKAGSGRDRRKKVADLLEMLAKFSRR